jgi:nitroreductase
MLLKKYAETAERCQRNYDITQLLPKEHVDYILSVCTTMPSKNNKNLYRLLAIQNTSISKKIYIKGAWAAGDPNLKEVPNQYRNGQVYAPLLLIWDGSICPKGRNSREDHLMAVGISSGAAALAAAELGYKTGFCVCFEEKKVEGVLNKHIGQTLNLKITLMLGIGLPDSRFDRKECVLNDKVVYTCGSFNKITPILEIH